MSDKTVKFEDMYFAVEEKTIALPLKGEGKIWFRGWEIATRWAVDNTGQCWMSGGHGGTLYAVSSKSLYETALEASNEEKLELNRIMAITGRLPDKELSDEAARWVDVNAKNEKLENDC